MYFDNTNKSGIETHPKGWATQLRNPMTAIHHIFFEAGLGGFYDHTFANNVHRLYMYSQNYQYFF